MTRELISSIRSYPPAVFFILGNEFCERFSFYGMKALLTVYLLSEHHFSESTATLLYHSFSCIAFLSPLLGSLLADSYFGRYRVILYVSIFYVLGHGLLSFGALPRFDITIRGLFDSTGLLVIALATGGIKPCVSAFAVDQFSDSQKDLRAQFFSFFYFSINAGALLAIFTTPIFKTRVRCFGCDHCFPLAFGVPGLLMLISLILFVAGRNFYKKHPPSGHNVLFKTTRIIFEALRGRVCGGRIRGVEITMERERRDNEREGDRKEEEKERNDWLKIAHPRFSFSEIDEVRSLLKVCVMLSPIVLFWALFDQKGSTWIHLIRRLDLRIGPIMVIPEQLGALNPLLILLFVPIAEGFLYPFANKIVRVTPLRKMAVGGLLTALSFFMAAVVQMRAEQDQPMAVPLGSISFHSIGDRVGGASLCSSIRCIPLDGLTDGPVMAVPGVYGVEWNRDGTEKRSLNMSAGGTSHLFAVSTLANTPGGFDLAHVEYEMKKAPVGRSRLLFVCSDNQHSCRQNQSRFFVSKHKNDIVGEIELRHGGILDIYHDYFTPHEYTAHYGENCSGLDCPNMITIPTKMGEVKAIFISERGATQHRLVEANEVNVAWLIPQYVVITMGEVLLSVAGLEFAYSQAAPTMKSVMQAIWLLTVFLGNLLDILISGSHVIAEPAIEFITYGILMAAVMLIFILLGMRYRYVDYNTDQEMDEKERPKITELRTAIISQEDPLFADTKGRNDSAKVARL